MTKQQTHDPAMEADRLVLWNKYAVHGGPQGPFMLYGGFRDALRSLSPPEGAEEWIAVSERLPEVGDRTLVIDSHGYINIGTWCTNPVNGAISCQWAQVRGWMLLPKADFVKRKGAL